MKIMQLNFSKKIIIISTVLTVVNALAARYPMISLIMVIVETLVIVYFLFFKSISSFTLVFLLIISTSIENAQFALGSRSLTLYSIFNFPGLKSYLLLVILGIADIRVILLSNVNKMNFKKQSLLMLFERRFLLMSLIGLVMTVFSLILNDNMIFSHIDMWPYIARDVYSSFYTCSVLVVVIYSLTYSNSFGEKLRAFFPGLLIGVTIGAIILILCGNYYAVWESAYYITCPLILFFSPGLILFYFEKKNGYLCLIMGIVSLVLQIKFTVGIAGSWWLYVFVVIVVFIRKLVTLRNIHTTIVKRTLICICVYIGLVFLSDGLNAISNGHVLYKLESFINIFENTNIWTWYETLGGSIQTRVEEIVNILIELFNKPWFIPFGKGYGGTVLKHWGISNWDVSGSTFADVQILYQTYSSFHLGLAESIINFGMLGCVLGLKILRYLVVETIKHDGTMWLVLGGLWFLIFYACFYSFIIGIAWICFGIYSQQKRLE